MMSFWNKFLSFFKKEESNSRNCEGVSRNSLHIGINNYPGTANDLRGCVNDANNWEKFLREDFCFNTSKLLDSKATHKNVVREMKKVIRETKSGGHVVITFSGHGTNVKDQNGDEQDKRDEALCLYDKLLIDDELRDMFSQLPKDVSLTFISDCCHSGTITRSFLSTLYDEDAPRARYLPPEDDEEAFEIVPKSVAKKLMHPQGDMNEVLISGCNPTQYSYDAKISNQFQGAMSANAIAVIKENPECTYDEFYKKLRKRLPTRRFPQTPQLEGSPENKKRKMFS
jgi:hypothetical protein